MTLQHSNLTEMLMSPDKKMLMTGKDNWEIVPWGRNSLCLGEEFMTVSLQMAFIFKRQR